jgi:hypothetical protein
MIHDYKNIFSDAQAITASTTTDSTNVIDTEKAASNIGPGTPIWLHVKVNTTCTCATSSTMTVALQSCATSGGTYVTLLLSPTYTVGTLVKGYNALVASLPQTNLRYLKVLYTCAVGSGNTAGAFDAFLAPGAARA